MKARWFGQKVSSVIFSDSLWTAAKALTVAAAMVLTAWGAAQAAGADLLWQSGAAEVGKQEARAMAVDAADDVVLVGFGEAASGEGRIVKLRGDGSAVAWSASFNLNGGYDVATAVAVDGSGDVVAVGYGNNGINYDFHTVKYAGASGAVLWQHTWKGAAGGDDFATSVAVDALGDIYVGGYSQGAGGRDDAVLLRYAPGGPSADGMPLWVRTWNGAGDGHDRILAIAAGADGVAVTGESQNATPDFDAFTLKYDFAGNLLWQKTYSDTGDGRGRAVALDGAGNVVMAGYVSNGSNRDLYVAKFPAAGGSALWAKDPIDNGFDDEAVALGIDGAGDVYVTGTTYSLNTHLDVFTLKFDGIDGSERWRAQFNSTNGNMEYGQALAIDQSGDVFVAGYLDDAGSGQDDFLTLKYGKDTGTLLWSQAFDGTGHDDRAVGLGLQADGTVLVGGWSDRWSSATSDYDCYLVAYDPGAINPPTDLTARTVSNTEILLNWTDNSISEDGFAIERRIGDVGSFGRIATVCADATTFSDVDLIPDTRYLYRVMALSASAGDSRYSNLAEGRTTVIQEQTPSWMFTYDGGGDDLPEAIAVGPDSHPVVTGGSFSVAEVSFDYYTVKVDRSSASALWQARYDDPDFENDFATSVAVDGAGRTIITGYASLYGGGDGNTNDIYTLGYPAGGPPAAWTDQYNGPSGGDDRSSSVAVASDGSDNAVVIGYGKNALWNDDIYVLKYGPDGNRIWAATPFDGGGDDYPVALAVDGSGDIVVVGRSFNGSNDDMLVGKYAGDTGVQLWMQTYDGVGAGDDHAESVTVDAAGNIYVAGYASGIGSGDACLLKYDGAGTLVWEQLYDGEGRGYDIAKAVSIDPVDGEVLVAATSFVGADNHDFVLMRYLPDGTPKWQKRIDRPATDDSVEAMAMDRFGAATVTGSSGSDILAMKFDHQGGVIGANLVDGGYGEDAPVGVVVNAWGEAFVAGFTTNAANNADYVVFRANGENLAPPYPFSATAQISGVDLAWVDNSADEAGFLLQRHLGACSDPDILWNGDIDLAANATAYSDTGLSQGSIYCYRLRAYRGNGEFSREVLREATTAVPQAPANLSVSIPNSTEVRLGWEDYTAAGESGYHFVVQRCQGGGCTFADTDPLFIVTAPATGWSDTSVCPASTYRYRVMTKKEGVWASGFSTEVTGTTPAVGGAPSELVAQRTSEAQIRLQWTDNTADESGFRIERCVGSGCADFTQVGTVAGQSIFDDTGLALDTVYRYRVSAYRSADCGWQTAPSNIAEATTTLLAPGNLDAEAASSTQVNLSWADPSETETGFRIERCELTGTVPCDQTEQFAFLAAVGAGVTSYADPGVCSGSDFAYRVRAEKETVPSWQSAWSPTAQATGVAFQLPTGLSATQISESGIRLSWSDANADESGFYLERCSGDSTACASGAYVQVAVVPPGNSLAYDDAGLEANATYTYRVKAYKSADCAWESAPSSTASASTVPLSPGSLSATAVNTTRIDLAWSDLTVSETGYVLQRCIGSGSACDEDGEFLDTIALAADTHAYSDSEVCADSIYTYRVRAEKLTAASWQTAWSVIPVTTAPPAAPGDLILSNPTEYSVSVRWNDLSSDESGFVLERCAGEAASCTQDSDFVALRSYPGSSEGNQLLYHLNEPSWSSGAAGEVIDGSGQNAHGTAYNLTTSTEGHFEGAASFNGSSSYIATPVSINQSAGSPGATFEAWVYPTANDSYYRHVISTDNGGYDWGIVIRSGVWYVANGSSWINTGIAAPVNEWQHVAAVFVPGSGFLFYLNGALAYSSAYLYHDASSANVTVGRYGGSTYIYYHFAGLLDEVAIFNEPLSAAQIQGQYETGLQLYHSSDATVEPGYTYTYRVQAQKTAACSWAEATAATITTSAPAPPSGLTATASSTTTINLAWTDNTATETLFRIERCSADAAACLQDSDFVPIATIGADAVSYNDDGVCSDGSYTYRVRAEKEDAGAPVWQSLWTSVAQRAGAPSIPVDLGVANVSEEQIDLSWNFASDDRTGFHVERCSGDATACAAGPFTQVDDLTSTGTALSFSDSALASGTSYTYRLRAYKAGVGCPWEGSFAEVTGTTVTPSAPGTLTATAVDTTRIDLQWTDNTTSETDYRLERCSGEGCSGFSLLSVLGPDAETFSDASVCSGTAYTYRERAEKEDAGAPVWQTAWASADTTAPFPQAPSGLSATRVSEVETLLTWTDNTDDESGFRLEACEAGVTPCVLVPLGAGQSAYNHVGLEPGKTYTYRVLAFKEVAGACGWETAYTAAVSLQAQVLAPGSLVASVANTTRIDLAWTDPNATESGFEIERCEPGLANCITFTAGANATGYADETVCSGSSYTYAVRGVNNTASGWQSPWSEAVTSGADSYHAPLDLSASRLSEKEIRLDWTDNNGDESGFRVERCMGTACTEFPVPASADTSANYTDAALTVNTTYAYRLRAFKDVGSGCGWESDFSAGAGAKTDLLPPEPFSALAVDTTRIDLSWADRTAAETGFRIERCAGSDCGSHALLATVGPDETAYSDFSACSGSDYTYRIAPLNSTEGWPLVFSQASATSPSPNAPALSLSDLGHSQAILAWSDTNSDETEFSIQRCTGDGCNDFVQIGAVTGTSAYADAALAPSTPYRYRIQPIKNSFCPWPEVFSNELAVLTLPAPVDDLSATALDSMSVQLQWTDHAVDEQGYQVEMQMFHGLFTPIATLGQDSQLYIDHKAQPGLEHRYRIRPFRGEEYSPYSNEAAVVTPTYQAGDGGCR